MTTPSDRPTVRLSGPDELVALVPYLLGFHPATSLVAIAFHGTRVLFARRVDLPATPDELPAWELAARDLAARFGRDDATEAILIGYGTIEQVHAPMHAAADALSAVSIPVIDVLRVEDGLYFSLTPDNPDGSPPEGTPFDPATSVAAAVSVADGWAVLPDRAAVAARITPVTGPARDRMAQATFAAAAYALDRLTTEAPEQSLGTPAGQALVAEGRIRFLQAQHQYQAGTPIGDQDAALLTVLLSLPPVRDFAAHRSTAEPWQIEMWIDLVRRAEEDFAAAPATLLTLSALLDGNGALADLAIQRALQADPGDVLAQRVANAVAAGIDPATVTALLTD
jgi:hypothetical protein